MLFRSISVTRANEVGHDHDVLPRVEVAWRVGPLIKRQRLALERECLEPLVAPVRDEQHRLRAAFVDYETVRAIELAGLRALAAERPDVLAVVVVLQSNWIRSRRRRTCHRSARWPRWSASTCGGLPFASNLYLSRLLRVTERPHVSPVRVALTTTPRLVSQRYEEFLAAFLADVQAVRATLELLAPDSDERPFSSKTTIVSWISLPSCTV